MNRKILIQGFLKMFVPLLVGTVTAIAAGVSAGLMFGYDPKHTFFYIVMPILGGGIGEGILPLSIGYAALGGGIEGAQWLIHNFHTAEWDDWLTDVGAAAVALGLVWAWRRYRRGD